MSESSESLGPEQLRALDDALLAESLQGPEAEAAAAVVLASVEAETALVDLELPASLMAALEADAAAHFEPEQASGEANEARESNSSSIVPWLVAAVAVAAVALVWASNQASLLHAISTHADVVSAMDEREDDELAPAEVEPEVEPLQPAPAPTPALGDDPAIRLADWLLEQPELSVTALAAGGDTTGNDAAGDVLWSEEEQRGYMMLRGLKPNDPAVEQYQLWIFDTSRDERFPVDGGVFDVPSGQADVVVPIDAALPVDRPSLYAITVEQPGGVVVSDRSRIALLGTVRL